MSRVTCPRCRLPERTCLCAQVQPQTCPLPVVVLQHPQEAKHAKSTVPLLQLALPDVTRVVAEAMAPLSPPAQGRWWLLYPDDKAVDIDTTAPAGLDISGLVVLDGTWRKTRRLRHLNPWLNELPALSFSRAPAGRYAMRKGPGGQALSTLESLAHVLHRLSPVFDPAPLHHLLACRVAQFHPHGYA
ncbi:DTW domain-containing protein [Oceanimonas sp. GK1]|uniref:tRNA-uridine aminocarboxypropyltransferase n=1 Tax=Oceanimonas sp. (strain GK1 / IBRC-M 10197) TaxID=511062 RepID=UPI0002494F39|nr:tRNA-uridine aminocarboxypropyltransferase [Oceanimonas sp. GK1]AEY00762.1 DTW domain-containing protein [Oceanimonas sp. GK1]